jgi:hypothetical protein
LAGLAHRGHGLASKFGGAAGFAGAVFVVDGKLFVCLADCSHLCVSVRRRAPQKFLPQSGGAGEIAFAARGQGKIAPRVALDGMR